MILLTHHVLCGCQSSFFLWTSALLLNICHFAVRNAVSEGFSARRYSGRLSCPQNKTAFPIAEKAAARAEKVRNASKEADLPWIRRGFS